MLTVNATSAFAESANTVYLGGFPAGFTLNTTTVEVIGLCDVVTKQGAKSPAKDSGIIPGDIIESINGIKVESTEDIGDIIGKNYDSFNISVSRAGEIINLPITPANEVSSGKNRLGILVKDSINGIGTVTYIDKAHNKFASLGHPVTDLKNNMIEIHGGKVYGCLIYDVKRGIKGTPGELKGAFDSATNIGSAKINSPCGVFGDLDLGFDTSKLVRVEKGTIDDAQIGKACIYTTVHGSSAKKYNISIVKVDRKNKDNRNFVIKIDDEELIEAAGGIVQGMSGSPIVQNGKLIGAVTHVFINDPTRGYGIGIENMLSSY